MFLLVEMINLNSKQNEGNIRADVRVDGVLFLVAEDVAESRDDVRVRQELVGTEEVVKDFNFFGKLRNQENWISRVRHEYGRGQQKSGSNFVVVFW